MLQAANDNFIMLFHGIGGESIPSPSQYVASPVHVVVSLAPTLQLTDPYRDIPQTGAAGPWQLRSGPARSCRTGPV